MTKTTIAHVCKNCSNDFVGNFCNNCGQKDAHRITLSHVVHDVIHVFLHADKGIFPFMGNLLIAPGKLAFDYINGKRRMFNPFQYYILSVGLILFLMSKSSFYDELDTITNGSAQKIPGIMGKAMTDFNVFLRKNGNIITFLSMPLIALSSWLFFKKRKENYAEHFTMMILSMGQVCTVNAIFLLFTIFIKVPVSYSAGLSFVLVVLSLWMTYAQYYRLGIVRSFFKGLLVNVLGYFFQVILFIVLLIFYVVYLKTKAG
ncbi:MAG: DUF3667 domain-containing protein [Bacteroidota bacterium]